MASDSLHHEPHSKAFRHAEALLKVKTQAYREFSGWIDLELAQLEAGWTGKVVVASRRRKPSPQSRRWHE
jgi:hypothetical protein